jgi:hypothetical protein
MNESTHDPATDQTPGATVPPTSSPDCGTCPFRRKAMEDADKTPPKGNRRLIDDIRALDIPARAKAELALLCTKARELGRKIIRFMKRHRHLGEAAVLGAVIAYLFCHIPIIGGFLALVSMALSVATGVLMELKESLAALFAADIPAYV